MSAPATHRATIPAQRRRQAREPVEHCPGCGQWKMRRRSCPVCYDLAHRVLTIGAWSSVGVMYAALFVLLTAWWA